MSEEQILDMIFLWDYLVWAKIKREAGWTVSTVIDGGSAMDSHRHVAIEKRKRM